MALTKKQTKELEDILSKLRKGKNALMRDDVLICTTKLAHLKSYYNAEGEGITPMQKFVGSDTMYLINGIQQLESFLEQTT